MEKVRLKSWTEKVIRRRKRRIMEAAKEHEKLLWDTALFVVARECRQLC